MAPPTATASKTGSRFKIFKIIGEIIAELKKVVWLSRREIIYLTILVLIVSAAAGAFLGALDYGFAALVEKIFLGR